MPFYWGDWFKATDIQSLPRHIRCTWFEMLGRMWESTDRGYLSINGTAPTDRELAMILGFGDNVFECKKHLNYLQKKKIFSRNSEGIIYNRRMVKDAEISRLRAEAGQKGMSVRYNKTYNKNLTNTEYENEYEYEDKNKDKRSALGLEQHLLQMWGGRDGKLTVPILQDMIKMGDKHGFDKLFEAIEIAAKANAKNFRYVEGILNKNGKSKKGELRDTVEEDPEYKKWAGKYEK